MTRPKPLQNDLIVVDFGDSERLHPPLRGVVRIVSLWCALKHALRRVFNLRSARPLVVPIAQGGGAATNAFPRTVTVTSPNQLLELDKHDDAVHEAAYQSSLRLLEPPLARIIPEHGGISLAHLSRLHSIGYIRRATVLLRAVQHLCENHEVRTVHVINGDIALAHALARVCQANGSRVRTAVPRILESLRAARDTFTRTSIRRRPKPSPASDSPHSVFSDLGRCDVLIVSESTPMRRMFEPVEERILAENRTVRVARLQYNGATQEQKSERHTVIYAPRPDDRVPRRSRFRQLTPARGGTALPMIPTEVLGNTLSIPLDTMVQHQFERMFDLQADHIDDVNAMLSQLDPALVVVGNDRWWIGQTFVLAAQQRGIPTLMLQDGAANYAAEWYFGVADTAALSSSFLAHRLRYPAGAVPDIHVVGQPRYDATSPPVPASATGEDARRGRKLLFATQTVQDPAFVQAVVIALLDVPGATITLRPHPSEDIAVHRRLAARYPNRVILSNTETSLEALRESAVLVCQSSTLVIEAALMRVPAVTVNLTGLPDLSPFARLRLAEGVSNTEDLTRCVAELLDNTERYAAARTRAAESGGLSFMLGPVDGNAASRAAKLILAKVANHAVL